MSPVVSHIVALLTGVLIGAAGNYFADSFTDQRRAKQREREAKKRFKEVEDLMPELIAEMRTDQLEDPSGTRREFFPYDIGAIYAPGPNMLFYEPKKHQALKSKLIVLENHGYIADVSVSDTKRYRMSEAFVLLLKENAAIITAQRATRVAD